MPDSKNAAGISTGGSGGLKGMMHNLKEKLHDTHLHDLRAQATHIKHRIGKFENLINPNHRHDEAHEKRTDEKRQRLRDQHRFNSYAPERDGNKIKWYIDGRNYFWVALSSMLVSEEHVANPGTTGRFRRIGESKRNHLHCRLVAVARVGASCLLFLPHTLGALIVSSSCEDLRTLMKNGVWTRS